MSLSRRDLLKSAVGTSTLFALAPTMPAVLQRTAAAAAASRRRDTVLVVLQLSGGNDGLNTIVPHTDDAYGRARRTLRLTSREVLKINDDLGFHPQMPGFSRLLKGGNLAVVQGVGYPQANRNHPVAMRNWHTAQPDDQNCPTGWIGRAVDQLSAPDTPAAPGVFVAPIQPTLAVRAEHAVVPTIRDARDAVLRDRAESTHGNHADRLAEAAGLPHADNENPLLQTVRRNTRAAADASKRIAAVVDDAAGTAEYPPLQLAQSLRTVAQLIRADVGIRIFFTELGGGGIGGFDNHANQRDNHAALLKQLSESIAAFTDDLARDRQLDRVTLMTFSEFGRTLTENGRRGTGHGDAQPVFLIGGRLRGGLVGTPPSLTDLDQDAPKFHTDFRQVYATMLDSWLGVDSQAVLGAKYPPLDLFNT